MTSKVILISPATSQSLRQARFDDGGPLDEAGTARARAAAGSLPRAGRVVLSPGSVRCHETAVALLLLGEEEPGLAPLNVGRWRGLTLDEVAATEPEGMARWLSDPTWAPHHGESVEDMCARVGQWLETAQGSEKRTLAVVEPEIVRAAVVCALGLPTTAFWRLDVPPLSATELSGRSGRWNLRLGRRLDVSGAAAAP
ncbi:histidine phosphatase family protein [Streptomyces sp. NPDC093065]|uniref:histidine phosphatase family protein n=1 Tax=Streptomyces sp. NPDC093065 TaxID=3366021 RepID=UPI00381E70CE